MRRLTLRRRYGAARADGPAPLLPFGSALHGLRSTSCATSDLLDRSPAASPITIVPMLAAICQSQERASHPAMSIAATAVGLQATLAEDPEAAAPRLSAEVRVAEDARRRRRRRPRRRPNGDGGAEAQARRRVEHEGAAGRAEAVDRPEERRRARPRRTRARCDHVRSARDVCLLRKGSITAASTRARSEVGLKPALPSRAYTSALSGSR